MELGSFFEFPEFNCINLEESVYYEIITSYNNYTFFRDGRQGIKYILSDIKERRYKDYYVPAYLCNSILKPFKELNLNIKFYGHKHPICPVFNGSEIENSVIFVLDYFGTEFISNEEINEFLYNGNIVIVDITHSMLNKNRFLINHDNYYMISSLRKIFPIPDGGIVYHNNTKFEFYNSFPHNYENMLEAMILKSFYLKDKSIVSTELNGLKNYFLSLYQKYEEKKDNDSIDSQNIPNISIYILKNISFSNIIKKRFDNLNFMYKNIDDEYFLYDYTEIKSPFTMPLIFKSEKERNKIRNFLIKNYIYPPIHWNIKDIVPKNFIYEHDLSKRILSLPIDQRYNPKDLDRVISLLNKVL